MKINTKPVTYISQNSEIKPKESHIKSKLSEDVFVPSFGRSEEPKKTSFAEKINGLISSVFSGKNPKEPVITTNIPSKGFVSEVTKDTYTSSASEGRKTSLSYIDPVYEDYSKISAELNPGTLETVRDVKNCYYASNFAAPGGSVAIPSPLNKTLTTSDLFQCNGVAFVDKKHNLQTLLHFAPGVNHKDNKALVEYLLSFMKPEDTEITIVPGCYPETNETVACLTNIIKEVSPDYDIKYMNFPDKDHKTLVLKNGELKCCKKSNPKEKNINPEDGIVWATHKNAGVKS